MFANFTKTNPEIPSAPTNDDQAQSYRLKKIDEAEKFLRDEVLKRERLAKKFKRRANATTISDTSIITAITALELASVVTLTTGLRIPISVALASAGLALGIGSAIIHKTQKVLISNCLLYTSPSPRDS